MNKNCLIPHTASIYSFLTLLAIGCFNSEQEATVNDESDPPATDARLSYNENDTISDNDSKETSATDYQHQSENNTSFDTESEEGTETEIDTVSLPGHRCASSVELTEDALPYTLEGKFFDDPQGDVSCVTEPSNAVWFSYTPKATGIYDINVYNSNVLEPEIADGSGWTYLLVFEGEGCDPLGNRYICTTQFVANAFARRELLGDTAYLLLIHTSNNDNEMVDPKINISLFEPDPGEGCEYAVDITDIAPDEMSFTQRYEEGEIWFKYNASVSGPVEITAAHNGANDGHNFSLEIYESDDCNALGTAILRDSCPDIALMGNTELQADTTYLIVLTSKGSVDSLWDPYININW